MRLALLSLADRIVVSTQGLTDSNERAIVPYSELLMKASQDYDYRNLLVQMGEQPAMIKYLSLDQNKKTSPNGKLCSGTHGAVLLRNNDARWNSKLFKR